MSPLIRPAELVSLLKEKNLIIIDARSGPDAFARYQEGHLPEAVHVDLDKDLSQKKEDAANGGRHPLPDIAVFAALLGHLGIQLSSHVIVYDDKSGANAAARFWWMLRAAGHHHVQVLDGGLKAAVDAGIPLEKGIDYPLDMTLYPIRDWQFPLVGIEAVSKAASNPTKIVIDVREAYRYNGESEPIDLVAGHIPGAINVPYTSNLDADGNFLSKELLAAKYKAIIEPAGPENVIVHCGSGVTACHTLLALEEAGLNGAALYVGSWSEWSRSERPMATGEETGSQE